IDGSWELLSEWEQDAWRQTSVFEGGFTLSAAEAVLDLRAWPRAPDVVHVLQSLIDKSLLRLVPPDPGSRTWEPRFSMYVSLQAYAHAKLAPGDAAEVERRHGRWYSALGADDAIERLSDATRWLALER